MNRARRSILSVPANVEKMFHKATGLNADVLMFDLEDSVPISEKASARNNIIKYINELNWEGKTISVRINPVDSVHAYKDLIEVTKACGNVIDTFVLPKVENVEDIHFADKLLSALETECGIENIIGLEISIESALGLSKVNELAKASRRNRTLVFGIADYSTSVEARLVSISGHGEAEEEIYPGHRWHFVLSNIVMAAKANNLMAIDAPYGNFKDNDGLAKSASMASALGINGKWAIHPNQIETINKVFSPQPEEIERIKLIISAADKAEEEGRGSVSIDGRMVDRATVRLAKKQMEVIKSLGLL